MEIKTCKLRFKLDETARNQNEKEGGNGRETQEIAVPLTEELLALPGRIENGEFVFNLSEFLDTFSYYLVFDSSVGVKWQARGRLFRFSYNPSTGEILRVAKNLAKTDQEITQRLGNLRKELTEKRKSQVQLCGSWVEENGSEHLKASFRQGYNRYDLLVKEFLDIEGAIKSKVPSKKALKEALVWFNSSCFEPFRWTREEVFWTKSSETSLFALELLEKIKDSFGVESQIIEGHMMSRENYFSGFRFYEPGEALLVAIDSSLIIQKIPYIPSV